MKRKFDGLNITKSVLSLDETPPSPKRLISAATKLKNELPTDLQMKRILLKKLSSLVEDLHIKARVASQQSTLDMGEFLGIDKALQSIQGELLNNTSSLPKLINVSKAIPKS